MSKVVVMDMIADEIGMARRRHKCNVCSEVIGRRTVRIKRLVYDGDGSFERQHIHEACDVSARFGSGAGVAKFTAHSGA